MKNRFQKCCGPVAIAASLQLAACGGGSSPVVAGSDVLTGVFLDSPVSGLRFATSSQTGTTNANGEFRYRAGELVRFSLGSIQLPEVAAKPVLTPMDLANTTNLNDPQVVNLLTFLQSLDADGVPANGIVIPAIPSSLASVTFDLNVASVTFRANPAVANFINGVIPGRILVADAAAKLAFQSTLNGAGGTTRVNVAPYANPGPAQSATTGTLVQLNGSASSDANNDSLTYQWTLLSKPVGSAALLTSSLTSIPTFTPDVAGTYVLGLRVNDGALVSSLATVSVTASLPVSQSAVPSGYTLVWSDEFTSSSAQLPDSSKWAYDTSQNSVGWYNNELQYYSNGRTQNSVVQDGKLVITARKENLSSSVTDWGRQAYTSARLITRGKAAWTYGFFEIRAKLPCGAGTWPAIWTLGSTIDTWPAQGEIDIMEQKGWDKGTVLGTIHTLAGSGGNGSSGFTALADACTAFHNYQIKWTANAIDFYIDGVRYREPYVNPTPGIANNAWPFDKPQYLLVNLAVGGVLGGTVNDATLSSTSLEVDYVRVYQAP